MPARRVSGESAVSCRAGNMATQGSTIIGAETMALDAGKPDSTRDGANQLGTVHLADHAADHLVSHRKHDRGVPDCTPPPPPPPQG